MRGAGHCQGLPRQPAREEGWACCPGGAARGGRRQRGQGQAERDLQRPTKGIQRQRMAETRSERGRLWERGRRQVLVRVWETTETDNWQGGTDSQTGWLPGRERACLGAGGSHRGMTEMDGPVAGGDKPEAGGNIEADNKERTGTEGQAGHADGEAEQTAAGQGSGSLRTGRKVPGAQSWPQSGPLLSGLPIGGMGITSPVQTPHLPASPRAQSTHSWQGDWSEIPSLPTRQGQVSRPWESAQSFLPTFTGSDHPLVTMEAPSVQTAHLSPCESE